MKWRVPIENGESNRFIIYKIYNRIVRSTVKPVYKGHSREAENMWPLGTVALYIQVKIIYALVIDG